MSHAWFKKKMIKKMIKKYFIMLLGMMMFFLTIILSVKGIENGSIMNTDYNNPKIRFTEMLFNPEGSDTGREWIELYIDCDMNYEEENISGINISRYRLNESNTKHNIYRYNDERICGYVVICNDCESFDAEHPDISNNIGNISLLKSSFSLSNTGEYLSILEDDKILFETDYFGVNASEGRSVILINHTWIQSVIGGTPGYYKDDLPTSENNTLENITDEDFLTENMTVENNTLDNSTLEENITIEENNTLEDNTLEDNTQNETIEVNISSIISCQINLSIELANEQQYYDQGTKIFFYNNMSVAGINDKISYNIEYWIDDLSGNILKNKVMTNNLNQKSYTPKIDETDKILIIKNRLVNASCNISNESILEYSKIILIRNPDFEPEECTASDTINNLDESSGNTESYIDIAIKNLVKDYEITAEIYRGNTRKTVTDIYLKDESGKIIEKYHTKINEQYCSTELVWTISKEKPSCDKEHTLIFEGLGLSEERQLMIECPATQDNNSVKITTKSQTISSEKYGNDINSVNTLNNITYNDTLQTYNHTNQSQNQITGSSIYESANQKNRRYSLIGILITIGVGGMVLLIFLKKKYLKNI
jgi:hypothetical protein